jgi:ABC-type dipeptide/oligopeptide/nickel transport system ATPase component
LGRRARLRRHYAIDLLARCADPFARKCQRINGGCRALDNASNARRHTRCPHANARCSADRPLLQEVKGIRVACHAVEEGRI